MESKESLETAGAGIEFTETMRGFGSRTVTDDYDAAYKQGERDKSILEFTVTVSAPNLERMIADPAHEALLTGTVNAPALSTTLLRVVDGRFHLLVRDADKPGTRKMIYQMPLIADDGRRFHFEGFKTIHDDPGPDLWSDTTTLFVTIRDGSPSGAVIAKGRVHIHLKDFQKQLRTMKVTGGRNKLEELKTMARFGRFFMGALIEVYGPTPAGPVE
jgi:hypothetical protein